jgi:hypothetical protein
VNVSMGLYEVIVSERLTLEQKIEAIPRFAYPIHHLDGSDIGLIEQGEITEEDANLISEALRNGDVSHFKQHNDA